MGAIAGVASAKLTRNKLNAKLTCAMGELVPSGKGSMESNVNFYKASSSVHAMVATAKRKYTTARILSARVTLTAMMRTTIRIAIGMAAIAVTMLTPTLNSFFTVMNASVVIPKAHQASGFVLCQLTREILTVTTATTSCLATGMVATVVIRRANQAKYTL